MQETHLSHKHAHTLQQIFQHPTSYNLAWHDVVVFIKQSGTVQEGDNGRLTFTLNGISEVFHRSHGKDVADVQQVAELQHFLEKAGVKKDGTIALPEPAAPESLPEQEQHSHDRGHVNAEQNRDAEQQLKTQQREQNERSNFPGGNAQAHQQGNRQK